MDYDDLVSLGVFTKNQFEEELKKLDDELLSKSNGEWIDYMDFIKAPDFETRVLRAYLLAFLISEGRATLRTEPLTGTVWVRALSEKAKGPSKSVAISVSGAN